MAAHAPVRAAYDRPALDHLEGPCEDRSGAAHSSGGRQTGAPAAGFPAVSLRSADAMFEQHRYEKRVEQAAKRLFLEIRRAGRFTDEAQPGSALVAGGVLRSWPIDQLTGGDYRFMSDETVTAAVRGLTWWLIAFLDSCIEPTKPSVDHQATAELLVPLRGDVRGRLLERGRPIDHERVLGVISTVLTGRQPDVWEGTALADAHDMLAASMRHLVEESQRAAERPATSSALATERTTGAPQQPATLEVPPPGVPDARHDAPDEADAEQRRQVAPSRSERRAAPHPSSRPARAPLRPSLGPPDLTLPPLPPTRSRPAVQPDLTLPPPP
jgi:hypothetical protein